MINRMNEVVSRVKSTRDTIPPGTNSRGVDIIIAEVLDSTLARVPLMGTSYKYCQLLDGDAMIAVPELRFNARNINNLSLSTGEKVLVLLNGRTAPLILSAVGGTGTGVGDLVPHSHQGFYDGGWAGFLSGSL